LTNMNRLALLVVLAFVAASAAQWVKLNATNAPVARMDHCTDTLGSSTIVLFAGWSGTGQFLNDTWSVDVSPFLSRKPVNWVQDNALLISANMTRADHTINIQQPFSANPQLLSVAGGRYPSDTLTNEVLQLNNSQQWFVRPIAGPSPSPRMGHSSVIVNANSSTSNIVIFAGDGDQFTLDDLWSLKVSNDGSAGSWTQIKPAQGAAWPKARLWHTTVLVNSTTLMLFGGDESESGPTLNDLWLLDMNKWQWTELHPKGTLPSPRSGHTAVFYNDSMYIFGGQGVLGSTMNNQLWRYTMSTNTWTKLQPLGDAVPPPLLGHKASIALGNQMIVFGGCTANSVNKGCTAFTNDLWAYPLQ